MEIIKGIVMTVFLVGSLAWIVDIAMWNRQKRIDEENEEQKGS